MFDSKIRDNLRTIFPFTIRKEFVFEIVLDWFPCLISFFNIYLPHGVGAVATVWSHCMHLFYMHKLTESFIIGAGETGRK